MLNNLFKYSLNILAVLTGFAVAIFIALPTGEDVVNAVVKFPFLIAGVSLVLVIWAAMMLVISVILLFSEKKRNAAFVITTKTEVRDELEEKASSDAIKRTFIFNLAFLAFIFSLSGFHFDYIDKGEDVPIGVANFGYSLWHEEVGDSVEKMSAAIKKIDPEVKNQLESKGVQLEVKGTGLNSGSRLIPARVFSPFGMLCLILIQLIAYKLFLILNLRTMSEDD